MEFNLSLKHLYNSISEVLLNFFLKIALYYHFGFNGTVLFYKITHQLLKPSDIIVLLQGDRLDRVKETANIYKKNIAPQIVIIGNNDLIGRGTRNDENDLHLLELKKELINKGILENSIIIEDKSFNTKDQAVHMVTLAKKNSYKRMIIVTSAYHVLRAYLSFVKSSKQQLWNGVILMCSVNLPWKRLASGRSKTAWQMFLLELEKIKKYKNDTASIKEGLEYFNKFLKI
ncbi:MAG: YdcF family protein [Candidatus Staskawiczbacteria bacterium]|nr:YdcF family protein [Candidatus Staskawiczbacteria bacterium]MBI3337254.1 YdcF family protein [Candidatus Staskawiczbacteria bacterium]